MNTGATECKAWVLPLAPGRHAAIGEREMVHIIPEWVRLQTLPYCPVYCNKVLVWQGHLIPLFDIQAYINPGEERPQNDNPVICVVAYACPEQEVNYGGLLLHGIPYRTTVMDGQMCVYPGPDDLLWTTVAASCFSEPDSGPTPVLDLQRIFCATPEEKAAPGKRGGP